MKNNGRSLYSADIERACEVMRAGGVILYPTDTVWGIGCDATDSGAVKRIYRLKQRADSKAMILLVADGEMMRGYVDALPDAAAGLIASSGERPTTIVVDGARNVAPEVVAPDGSVGMRVPHDDFASLLCHEYGKPIVSTSANISGCAPAACFADIVSEIADGVDYACTSLRDDLPPSLPSKVVKIDRLGQITILRP